MKKVLSFIIAAAVSGASLAIPALAENDNVEIAFQIGDKVLKINGNDVEVEKPYVAGDGTTLVPLRVISEAFGAEVGWIGETKTITVDYSGKNIVLQIDNKEVTVNGETDELWEAPQLTENGYTMVPLRFISETFGAEVEYDDDTKAVTVSRTADEPYPTPSDTSPSPAATLSPFISPSPAATLAPDASPAPEDEESDIIGSVWNEDAGKLTDEDVAALIENHRSIRYNFEQSALPANIFDDELPIDLDDEDSTNYIIYATWVTTTDSFIVNQILTSEHEYVFGEDDPVGDFLTNAAIQTGLTIRDNIKKIDYIDGEDGEKIVVITMSDTDEILISQYIAIKRDKKGNLRYFMLENSFDGYYMLCERVQPDTHANHGAITNDYDIFVKAVSSIE